MHGGVQEFASIIGSSPLIRDYVQRVEVAWMSALDIRVLTSTLSLLPKLSTLSFWNTGRLYKSPNRQFLAFCGIQNIPPRRVDSPRKMSCGRAWLSLHSEVIALTPTMNTVQLLLDTFDIFTSIESLYFMSGTKTLIDQELRLKLRYPSTCRNLHTLELAFDGNGLFTWDPIKLLQDLISDSRPRHVRCTRWRCPGNARSLGMVLRDVGAEVEHLHLYLRWFIGAWN